MTSRINTTKSLVIAEAGVNHNGDPKLAYELIDAAAEAGADIVKFQTFKAENLVTRNATKAEYQERNTVKDENQYEMLKKLELDFKVFADLKEYCGNKGIQFLSTAFDPVSLDFINNQLKLDFLKIPSGELTNGPFVLDHAKTKKKLIISTGMATMQEVEEVLAICAFGYLDGETPNKSSFSEAYESSLGKEKLKERITLLHCTTEYPTPLEDVNLLAMNAMSEKFDLPVGLSDHTEGIFASLAAVARGASVIEKHFTLDKKLPGPDHQASLNPQELTQMISAIRSVEQCLGDGVKKSRPSEKKNIPIARKSLVASRKIQKGEDLTKENIAVMRPGDGKSPMCYWDILGTKAERDYLEGDKI